MTMSMILFLLLVSVVIWAGIALFSPMSREKLDIPDHMEIGPGGGIRVNTAKLIQSPEFKRQLDGFKRLYMRETIIALWQGKRPPNEVGGYGILTKKKLIIEWNDEWQAEMDKLEEYHDISYNILFDIPEEHPPASILLTADEIAEQYGSKEEKS